MTISTSPSLSQIQTEFGGSNPISLSEYYRGGANVPSVQHTSATDGNAISTSGAIRFGMFRSVDIIRLTISSDTTNYNIFTAAGSPGHRTTVVLTINNVYVYATTTGVYALDTGTGWAAGSTIWIINNGVVAGRGGAGGTSGTSGVGTGGSTGGHAFRAQWPVTVTNNNTFAGGGGGGGGAGGYFDGKSYLKTGGGGGGRVLGAGATTGGVTATLGAAGGGGTANTGTGGAGGNLGAAGSAGQNRSFNGGGGGPAGNYVVGNANVTWAVAGSRLGGAS